MRRKYQSSPPERIDPVTSVLLFSALVQGSNAQVSVANLPSLASWVTSLLPVDADARGSPPHNRSTRLWFAAQKASVHKVPTQYFSMIFVTVSKGRSVVVVA